MEEKDLGIIIAIAKNYKKALIEQNEKELENCRNGFKNYAKNFPTTADEMEQFIKALR